MISRRGLALCLSSTDALSGGPGDDDISSRDTVDCGPGFDRVTMDRADRPRNRESVN